MGSAWAQEGGCEINRQPPPVPPPDISNRDGIGFEEGEKVRFIILDNVKGEAVTIFLAAAAVEFEEGLPKVQQVPDTVEWMDTYARV